MCCLLVQYSILIKILVLKIWIEFYHLGFKNCLDIWKTFYNVCLSVYTNIKSLHIHVKQRCFHALLDNLVLELNFDIEVYYEDKINNAWKDAISLKLSKLIVVIFCCLLVQYSLGELLKDSIEYSERFWLVFDKFWLPLTGMDEIGNGYWITW